MSTPVLAMVVSVSVPVIVVDVNGLPARTMPEAAWRSAPVPPKVAVTGEMRLTVAPELVSPVPATLNPPAAAVVTPPPGCQCEPSQTAKQNVAPLPAVTGVPATQPTDESVNPHISPITGAGSRFA